MRFGSTNKYYGPSRRIISIRTGISAVRTAIVDIIQKIKNNRLTLLPHQEQLKEQQSDNKHIAEALLYPLVIWHIIVYNVS